MRFVQIGRISKATGRLFSRTQDMREDADYDALIRFDTVAASDLLEGANRFVKEAEALVKHLEEEQSSSP